MQIEALAEKVRKEVAKRLKTPENEVFLDFGKFGDFSTTAVIRVAKRTGKVPNELAEELAKKIKINGVEVRVERGFLNFYLTEESLNYNLKNLFKFDQSGTVVIDYSSPNIAKPFSVGHLRSTIIGESLKRIFERLGWKAVGVNFIGDWGTQFGKLMAAYNLWGNNQEPSIKFLFELYVKFHKEVEKDASLEDLGREWFKKLEDGDSTAVGLWKKFKENSLVEFEKIYKVLGTSHLEDGSESLFVNDAIKLVDELKKKGIVVEDDGALIIKTSAKVPLLLRKTNGTTIYAARDLAAAIWRIEKFKPTLLLYVVGNEQKLHFNQIFEGLKKMGVATPTEHTGFGMISLPEGKMSTRKGRIILLEDVLKDAIAKVSERMKERDAYNRKDSEIIGIGAVKFADLKTTRTRDVVFNWDMLKTEGETGPYVQYATVRAHRILERFGKVNEPETGWSENELNLARKTVLIRNAILDAAKYRRPDIVAKWLIESAQKFNEFYEKNRIEGHPTRIWLTHQFYNAMEEGLRLLGMRVPEKM